MSDIQSQRRQYGAHFQYQEDKDRLNILMCEIRMLRKRIRDYEKRCKDESTN